MWLTGGKKPQAPGKTLSTVPVAQAPLEINDAKITELQNRIQQLQREQLVAENALAQQNHPPGAVTQDPQQLRDSVSVGSAPGERPEDVLRAERKKREYLSLFSSNVALTYRKSTAGAATGAVEPALNLANAPLVPQDTSQIAQLFKELQPGLTSSAPVSSPNPKWTSGLVTSCF